MSTTTQQAVFDSVKYKQTTRQQWDMAAEAWYNWGPLLSKWLGPATELMLDRARIVSGSRVLDVAAGAGEQTMAIARRIGPEGQVLATDISSSILTYVENSAKLAGHSNVQVRELDGECLDQLAAASFDAVVSRVGLIYFPDQQKALRGMIHALKPGGLVGAMVYSTAEKNPFFSIPVSIIRRRAALPPPFPGQPGPFSLGAEGVLERVFTEAGLVNIETIRIDAPVRLESAAECLRFEKESFGALHQMLAGLSKQEQEEAWDEIEQALKAYENEDGFSGPCEMVVVVGTKL
ncbi:MAG: methyltransferase domain-containing protein [Sedimenticola sp.]|uniref:Methyltransferase domain-containing protein n=1 Tax=Sedimenticola thiotaurini TaxID=1543721 RepID=A0A558D2W0_9GAMM|nr:methyltransferase domain-containing protein [Sedimenticola sp.]TVT55355.1 MAG: methyltransferase domain-containing protein [Sedimenticola thiotaurini]